MFTYFDIWPINHSNFVPFLFSNREKLGFYEEIQIIFWDSVGFGSCCNCLTYILFDLALIIRYLAAVSGVKVWREEDGYGDEGFPQHCPVTAL